MTYRKSSRKCTTFTESETSTEQVAHMAARTEVCRALCAHFWMRTLRSSGRRTRESPSLTACPNVQAASLIGAAVVLMRTGVGDAVPEVAVQLSAAHSEADSRAGRPARKLPSDWRFRASERDSETANAQAVLRSPFGRCVGAAPQAGCRSSRSDPMPETMPRVQESTAETETVLMNVRA